MAKKSYDWVKGATLDDHSKQKHKILRDYFRAYLITRCTRPQQSKFRLAVIDGFSGAGKYSCGSFGSPLIFIEVLENTAQEINIMRANKGMQPVEIECFLTFNDDEPEAIERLKENSAPLLVKIKENHPKLHLQVSYQIKKFEKAYPEIKATLLSAGYRSVLFNLDQCGYKDVDSSSIKDIVTTWRAAEIFLTFPIEAIRTYLSADKSKNSVLTKNPEMLNKIYALIEGEKKIINKQEWLGGAEAIIFENLRNCAPYVSPFSINNPKGWRYWLIHFANNYRARQVYNNILHDNNATQAHYGRAGLNMLSYDPQQEGQLYIFDQGSREAAQNDLYDDIPRLITKHGDAIIIEDFYRDIYNETAAHSDDIHEMIIKNPDVEVITEAGGERKKPNTIKTSDVLRLRKQKSMFPIFFDQKIK